MECCVQHWVCVLRVRENGYSEKFGLERVECRMKKCRMRAVMQIQPRKPEEHDTIQENDTRRKSVLNCDHALYHQMS